MQRATDVCQKVFPTEPLDLAIASGFACALTSARVGDLLIGTDVISKMDAAEGRTREEAYPCSAEAALAAAQVARAEGLIVQSGRFITVPRVLWRADEKRAMAAVSGAIGADMESAAICAEAANREVPALVIRTVSDVLEEDLPLDFNLFLDRSCWTQGVLSCLTHPSTLVGLNRMRVQAGRSAEALSGFFGKFLDELD
jgi:adenosylhomocysteine nucleosidase